MVREFRISRMKESLVIAHSKNTDNRASNLSYVEMTLEQIAKTLKTTT